jgi:hypothetical protein
MDQIKNDSESRVFWPLSPQTKTPTAMNENLLSFFQRFKDDLNGNANEDFLRPIKSQVESLS